ncbi:MAG: HAMP domain-containing sensor histidine kinase [Ignavibacteriales bacterium]|nr:HAMP domain-containing sensor histidine kinase [Ignavibacteriales bacterium]
MNDIITNEELLKEIKLLNKENEDLKEQNANKDKFFFTLAHDLRSPFQALLGLSEILTTELNTLNKEEIFRFSSELNKSIHNQYDLLTNILDWARIKTGKIDFNPKPIDIYENVKKILLLFQSKASKKEIKFIADINKDTFVNADENMFAAILGNLISNAIKFSNKGGIAKIAMKVINENVVISVIDEGVGMDNEMICKINNFDSKFSTIGTAGERGTGLGLLITNDLLLLHNSKLILESEPNRGTKFSFMLPKG